MTGKEAVMFVLIISLAGGLAYQLKATRDLEQEIKRIRGSETGVNVSEPSATNSASYSVRASPVDDVDLKKLDSRVYALERGVEILIRNQDVIVEKNRGLLIAIDAMNRSYEVQFRKLDPLYRSPIHGGDLKAVELLQVGPASVFTSAKGLF